MTPDSTFFSKVSYTFSIIGSAQKLVKQDLVHKNFENSVFEVKIIIQLITRHNDNL